MRDNVVPARCASLKIVLWKEKELFKMIITKKVKVIEDFATRQEARDYKRSLKADLSNAVEDLKENKDHYLSFNIKILKTDNEKPWRLIAKSEGTAYNVQQ